MKTWWLKLWFLSDWMLVSDKGERVFSPENYLHLSNQYHSSAVFISKVISWGQLFTIYQFLWIIQDRATTKMLVDEEKIIIWDNTPSFLRFAFTVRLVKGDCRFGWFCFFSRTYFFLFSVRNIKGSTILCSLLENLNYWFLYGCQVMLYFL